MMNPRRWSGGGALGRPSASSGPCPCPGARLVGGLERHSERQIQRGHTLAGFPPGNLHALASAPAVGRARPSSHVRSRWATRALCPRSHGGCFQAGHQKWARHMLAHPLAESSMAALERSSEPGRAPIDQTWACWPSCRSPHRDVVYRRPPDPAHVPDSVPAFVPASLKGLLSGQGRPARTGHVPWSTGGSGPLNSRSPEEVGGAALACGRARQRASSSRGPAMRRHRRSDGEKRPSSAATSVTRPTRKARSTRRCRCGLGRLSAATLPMIDAWNQDSRMVTMRSPQMIGARGLEEAGPSRISTVRPGGNEAEARRQGGAVGRRPSGVVPGRGAVGRGRRGRRR